jgi:hypothetical protein
MAEAEYPRDLHGYGRNPPDSRWPGDARIAVQFVVNFEEGGENNILHGDGASEAFLSDVLGGQPWRGSATPILNRCTNMVRAQVSGGYGGFSSAFCQRTGVRKNMAPYQRSWRSLRASAGAALF